MTEPRRDARALSQASDAELAAALTELGAALVYPDPTDADGVDLATRVRQRLVAANAPAPMRPRAAWLPTFRPARRGLVFALAAILALAAVAAAAGFGLPGLRILFGGPTPPSPTPTLAPGATPVMSPGLPGANLGLGEFTPFEALEPAGFTLRLPMAYGLPDASYVRDGRVSLVWAPQAGLPATTTPDVGLLISEFVGTTDSGYYEKMLGAGGVLTPVAVAGNPGYWLAGDLHYFVYVDAAGQEVSDSRRFVGDTLVWTADGLTFRLESGLSRDAAITLADSLYSPSTIVTCADWLLLADEDRLEAADQLTGDEAALLERIRLRQHRAPGTARDILVADVAASLTKNCELASANPAVADLFAALYTGPVPAPEPSGEPAATPVVAP